MIDFKGIDDDLNEMILDIEQVVNSLGGAAEGVQATMVKALKDEIARFEITNGKFVRAQDYKKRLQLIENKMRLLLGEKKYKGAIADYLGTFSTIEDRNVAMQKKYSQLKVDVNKLAPARKFVLDQSTYYLEGAGFRDTFIQPAKYLIMQQVTTGMSIEDSIQLLDRWGNGELTDGKATMGRATPDLKTYTTQIAQDTAFQYNGTINDIIKEEYKLNGFVYSGGLVDGSRPLCKHLVSQKRPIKFSEIEALLKKYPAGTIKGTNKDNFTVYRGGYRCNHLAYAVMIE